MTQQTMYSFHHVVLDLYIVSVCEHIFNTLNTLSTNGAASKLLFENSLSSEQ